MLSAFRDRHRVTDLVVVADAGMLSAADLGALEDAGFRHVFTATTLPEAEAADILTTLHAATGH